MITLNKLKSSMIGICPEPLYTKYRFVKNVSHWLKHDAIFIHIPKNGGWTVSLDYYGKFLGHVPVSYILAQTDQRLNGKTFFSHYRDPVERYLSAYSYLKGGAYNPESSVNSIFHRNSLHLGPIDFLKGLVNLPENKRDPIFRSQSYYCRSPAGVQIVNLYPISTIQSEKRSNRSVLSDNMQSYKNNDTLCNLIKLVYEKDYELSINDSN